MKVFDVLTRFMFVLVLISASSKGYAQPSFGFDTGNTVSIGVPQFSTTTSGPDNINLGNLNVSWQFPIFGKPGREIPFSFSLAYNNVIWKQKAVNQFALWPVDNLGWSFVGNVPSGAIAGNLHTAVNCNNQRFLKTDTYNNWVYADSSGIRHKFGTARYVINNCTGIETFSGPRAADDGSGYLLSPLDQGDAIVTTPSGVQLVATGPPGVAGNIKITDTNGNNVWGGGSNGITDTLGMTAVTVSSTFRTISPYFPPAIPIPGTTPVPGSVSFTYTDPNGSQETVVLNYGVFNVQTALGGCNGLPDFGPFATNLATSLVYPDGTSYTFAYEPTPGTSNGNVTGRISSVTLRTGGTINYTYGGAHDGLSCDTTDPFSTVSLTRQDQDGTTTYTRSNVSGSEWKTVITYPPDSVTGQVNQTDLYFQQIRAVGSAQYYETKRQIFQGPDTGSPLETLYTCYNGAAPDCSATAVTWPFTQITDVTQLANGQQKQSVTFKTPVGLTTEVDDYDWGNGASGPLLRKTLTTYATLGNNILDRPTTVTVQDGGGNQIAQTQYSYDEVAPDPTSGVPNHSAISGSRGNATTVKRWVNTSGTFVSTSNEYDDTGNLVATTDPLGHKTQFSHADNFTDGINRNSLAYVTQTSYPDTNSPNLAHHITSAKYEPNTGLTSMVTDQNGNQTNYTYDLLRRPLTITLPADPSGNQPQTIANYPDANTVTVQRKITTAQSDSQTAKLDGLGRAAHTMHSTPAGVATVDATYDSMGRLFTVTNPYFSTSDPTYGVTKNQYDALDRTITVTKPDGSASVSSYTGNCVTAADEAGKQRKSCSDGLGRRTSVFEDPTGLNYETDYQYDVLGNLLRVDQKGSAPGDRSQWRSRIFTYDSLSRLLTSNNPESGAIGYGYDANGNITSKADARSITTTYGYDALNRLTQESYSDGTPTASFAYDQTTLWGATLANPIGRLTSAMSGATVGSIFSYDSIGRILNEWTCLPSNCGTGSYPISASYDLANHLTALTYPSGRYVTFQYNSGSQLDEVQFAQMQGAVQPYNPYNYWTVSDANFDATGAPKSVTLGSGVIESYQFNSRLQPTRDTVAVPSGSTFADHVYNYGTQDNGNLSSVLDQLSAAYTQNYTYDSLNRLASATETRWGMNYVYDAWGNYLQQNLTLGTGYQHQYVALTNNRLSGNTYDPNGNVLNDGLHQYAFDGANRMKSVDSTGATYTYDALGQRVRKDTGGNYTEYIYFGGNVIGEKDQAGNWSDYVYANGRRIAQANNFENQLQISGQVCSSCGTQTYNFKFNSIGSLAGRVVQSSDVLRWQQWQVTGSVGGMVIGYTDGTQSAWTGSVTNQWQSLAVPPSVGKTISFIGVYQDSATSPGAWTTYYQYIVFTSADGSVTSLFSQNPAVPAMTGSGTSGETGVSAAIHNCIGVGCWPLFTTTYYHSDQIGSSRLLTNGQGYPVWQGTFLPFGEEYNPQATTNHYKFSGKERDSESNLDYFGARYYASGMGRFVTPDWSAAAAPIPYADLTDPQSFNLYSYVRNRPTAQIDPDGHYVLGANGAEMEAEYVANMEAELEAAQQQQQQPPAPAPQPPPTPTPTPAAAPAQPLPTPEKAKDIKIVGPEEQIANSIHNQRCSDCPCELNPLPTADTPSVGPHIPHSTGHWDTDQPDFPRWVDDDDPAPPSDYELPHTEKALPKGRESYTKEPEDRENREVPPLL